jgi:hypothetical protein
MIDSLESDLDYLRKQPYDEIFLIINLQSQYNITVTTGRDLLSFFISMLKPVWPCLVVGYAGGMTITSVSIYNMLYMYKKIMITIRREGPDSETLKFAWSFSPHHSIFFCSQFIVNAIFLCNLLAAALFLTCYLISFQAVRNLFFEYLKTRPPEFWVSLVPVVLG